MNGTRYLVVTADDFGIGPATSQGILDLAAMGQVASTVLLVTSPYAEEAVRQWRHAGMPLEVGWHPCLTLDRPAAPVSQVPSLVDAEGRFWSLAQFIRRLCLGLIRSGQIEIELQAQYRRFHDLLGRPPSNVNSHHHVQIFPPVGEMLRRILSRSRPLPYLRRVREPWCTLVAVPGARAKRAFISFWGQREARQQSQQTFLGNDWLAGITDPPWVHDPLFLVRWLAHIPGQVVELTCHPGYLDSSLVGRDCRPDDGQLERRVQELKRLKHPSFREACQRAGFKLITPSELTRLPDRESAAAA